MYKHIVKYRYKTPEGNLSAVKDLEFELDKELDYDGPGAWRDICRNMIANKTGLNKSDVLNDDNLHFTCKGKINSNNNSQTSNNTSSRTIENKTSNSKNHSSSNEDLVSTWQPHPDMPDHIRVITPDKLHLYSNKSDYWAKQKKQKEDLKNAFAHFGLNTEEDLKKAKEKAKNENIAKLKSEGRNFQAFILKYRTGIIVIITSVIVSLLAIFVFLGENTAKQDALKTHSELELYEDSLILCIQNKQFEKAIEYANKLKHPMHEDMENMEFDAWNGYPKYDEYWDKKREEYKNLIFSERATETVPKPNKSSKKNKSVKEKSKKKASKSNQNSEDRIEIVPDSDEELDDIYR
jgi:hypothetical protein